jgi:hypothetical protein
MTVNSITRVNSVTSSSSKGKKCPLPEDFVSSEHPSVQAMVEPGVGMTTSSKFLRRLIGGKNGLH